MRYRPLAIGLLLFFFLDGEGATGAEMIREWGHGYLISKKSQLNLNSNKPQKPSRVTRREEGTRSLVQWAESIWELLEHVVRRDALRYSQLGMGMVSSWSMRLGVSPTSENKSKNGNDWWHWFKKYHPSINAPTIFDKLIWFDWLDECVDAWIDVDGCGMWIDVGGCGCIEMACEPRDWSVFRIRTISGPEPTSLLTRSH